MRIHIISQEYFSDLLHLPTDYFVHYFTDCRNFLALVKGYQEPHILILDQKCLANKLGFNLIRNKFGSVRMFFIVDEIPPNSMNARFFILRNEMTAEELVRRFPA